MSADTAAQLRAQIPASTDPERLERMAREAEANEPKPRYRLDKATIYEDGHRVLMLTGQCDGVTLKEVQALRERIVRLLNDEAGAIDRYRYAVEWSAADSWDGCPDCRARLEWARSMDFKRLTADEIAAIGKHYLRGAK